MDNTDGIEAVAFDIDGTLYPNLRMYRASWPVVARHFSLFRAFGRARSQIRTQRPVHDLHGETVAITATLLNRDVDQVAREIDQIIYQEWESRLVQVGLYPGARELVLWLREHGIPTAALSDFPVERKIRLLGIENLWDVAFSSEETGYLKPNPEPFERLIADLERPAERILYVGNSYHYDVVGARSCGMKTAHVTRRRHRTSPADLQFRDFHELRTWLVPRLSMK
jgi:putative hydrolase of the HAD superfamily